MSDFKTRMENATDDERLAMAFELNDKPIVPFRGAIFGLNKYGVQLVHGPKAANDCGLYVHVDDIEKYQAFEKSHEVTK